ncbi:hypothetical protein QIS74_11079 [Colletotrichum tabaci]|uniref:Uncharacterized protein n=1 Tax=Colletotrichum tabaci TaxID=1209068 RepID=A0AAV9SZH1_9PEZI
MFPPGQTRHLEDLIALRYLVFTLLVDEAMSGPVILELPEERAFFLVLEALFGEPVERQAVEGAPSLVGDLGDGAVQGADPAGEVGRSLDVHWASRVQEFVEGDPT